MINQNAIIGWRQNVPWRLDSQIEQDLILHAMIQVIYSDPFLSEKLAFRGGTCLNKLIWKVPLRYSEDLDFVQINPEKIGPTGDRLRKVLKEIIPHDPEWEVKKGSFKLNYFFEAESNPHQKQKIKIEINTREHRCFEGYRKERLTLRSLWRNGEADVVTFSKEELLATKLRALYQRRKGRDLFDLWKSQEFKPNYKNVAHLFIKYIETNGKKISNKMMVKNLGEKLSDKNFLNDIAPLISPKTVYDPVRAFEFLHSNILIFIP